MEHSQGNAVLETELDATEEILLCGEPGWALVPGLLLPTEPLEQEHREVGAL